MTLARLAALELWTSFRLLGSLAILLASGGIAVAVGSVTAGSRGPLVASAPPVAGWYGIALAVAVALVAGMVAGAFAADRARGFSGWLVSRTAPRSSLLVAWFGVGTALMVAGGALSGLIAWLALLGGGLVVAEQAPAFAGAMAACLACGVVSVAVGLLAGTVLATHWAMLTTVLLIAAWLGGAAVALPAETLPGGGFVTLATFHLGRGPIGDSLLSAGVTLGLAAAVLVMALAAFSWVDL
ncbi:MAG: hypothetical protein ABI622_03635 [Chloroflexota bacterium]